jgi:hypothetical protein
MNESLIAMRKKAKESEKILMSIADATDEIFRKLFVNTQYYLLNYSIHNRGKLYFECCKKIFLC